MNDDNVKIPPPIASISDSTSIHLSYIRRDIDEIKINQQKSHEEIKGTIDQLRNAYVTSVDFNEHLKRDDDHEDRIRTLERSFWKYTGFSAGIAGIISLFGNYLLNLLK